MTWLIRLCLCLPRLAQAQTLTVKAPDRPINDPDNDSQLRPINPDMPLAVLHSGPVPGVSSPTARPGSQGSHRRGSAAAA